MKIKIAKDFSKSPGPRYRNEGRYSGEEFRETVLSPKVVEAIRTSEQLIIDFDGTYGFGTSFLEEAFGGLIRIDNLSLQDLMRVIKFISIEEPDLIDEVNRYLNDAAREANR